MALIDKSCTTCTCYWSATVTVVEEYRDLEIYVRDYSRPLKMVPFESLGTASYSHSVATMVVSLTISTQYTNLINIDSRM